MIIAAASSWLCCWGCRAKWLGLCDLRKKNTGVLKSHPRWSGVTQILKSGPEDGQGQRMGRASSCLAGHLPQPITQDPRRVKRLSGSTCTGEDQILFSE